MPASWIIARKDLRQHLTTWVSWALWIVFLELTSMMFYVALTDFHERRLHIIDRRAFALLDTMNITERVLSPTLSYMATFLALLLPLMTMGCIAGESRRGTLDLINATPTAPSTIVAGKFLATASISVVALVPTLILPLLLTFWSPAGREVVDWGTVATGYAGVIGMICVSVAIGVWASAASESRIVAATVALFLIMALLALGLAAQGAPQPWGRWLGELAMGPHIDRASRGLLRTSDVTYFLSMTLAALYLAARRLGRDAP